MSNIVCSGHKTLSANFTGEIKHEILVYDFDADGGAYDGNLYILATMSGKVMIDRVIVRTLDGFTSGDAATIIVGHTDNDDYFVDATAGAIANLTTADLVAAAATKNPIVLASGKQITMTIGVADLTAGSIAVEVWYKDARAA